MEPSIVCFNKLSRCFWCMLISENHRSREIFVPGEKSRLLWRLSGKESACQCRWCRFDSWMGKIPWGKKWQPIPVFLPGKSHGQRSLVGYSPWDCKQLETTWQLSTWGITVLCIRASNWKQKCQSIERLVQLIQWEYLIACGKGHAMECT